MTASSCARSVLSPKVVYRIQSHPSRRLLRERLLAGLPECNVQVVEHESDPPSPWAGYKACLQSLADEDFTHAVVIQDDGIVCNNFPLAVSRVIEAVPDNPVCLFLPMVSATKRQAMLAGKAGHHFVELLPRGFMPVVGVIWPKKQALDFLSWSATSPALVRRNGERIEHRSDDAMAHLFAKVTRVKVFATIPSLVQHPDDAPSTISRKPGGRTALFWHGDNWDPLTVDWKL